MRCSLQEKDKRHGLTSSNVVIIKFREKKLGGCTCSSKETRPNLGFLIAGGCLGFVGNLIGAVLLEMSLCCLHLSCMDAHHSVEHTKSMVLDINHTF